MHDHDHAHAGLITTSAIVNFQKGRARPPQLNLTLAPCNVKFNENPGPVPRGGNIYMWIDHVYQWDSIDLA